MKKSYWPRDVGCAPRTRTVFAANFNGARCALYAGFLITKKNFKVAKNIYRLRFVILLLLSPVMHAQEDEPQLDDNLFDLEFVEPGETNQDETASWYEPFTYKLSYQTITQINQHTSTDILGNTFTEEPELENNRLSLLVKYQHAFAPGWLLQGNARAKVYLRNDYEYEANNNNTETEFWLDELFVQRSFDDHSFKVGRQTVVWGQAEGNSVLDVINITELRDLSVVNIEDARLNQFFVVWDRFHQRTSLSTFVNLYPEFDPAVKPGSPLYVPTLYKRGDLDRDKALFEFGSRYRWTFTGSDIAVMAAYLYENTLRYDAPPALIGNAIAVENDYWLLGISANKAIDKLLLVADLAYSHGVVADTVNPNTLVADRHQNNRVGTSFGFEYGIDAEQQLSFSLRLETYLDQEAAPAGQELMNDNVFGTYLLRYTNTSATGDLTFAGSLQRELEGTFVLGSVSLNYTIDDNWSWFSQLVLTQATTNGPVFLDDDVRFEFTLNYAF